MFDVASNGTLFLDELENIPLSTQAKLLRVIQEHEFKAVGDTRTQATDVRLLAATNRDPKLMVAEGSLREDLFYRINVFPIEVPPLRDRRDDIPALAAHFLKSFSEELGRPPPHCSDGAMSLLMNHAWPGNVRELQNAIQRAVILASDDVIRQAHLASILESAPPGELEVPRTGEELKRLKKIARDKSVEDIEKLFVHETLKRHAWNVTRSAEAAGMQRANFQALMKKHGVRVRDTETPADEQQPE
jgi:transcriptional regulator with GAF, ATPase, and Fis domain